MTGLLWTLALNGPVAGGAYLVARSVFRQPPGFPRLLAAVVLGWTWATIGLMVLGSFWAIGRWGLLVWGTVGLALGLAFHRKFPEESGLQVTARPTSPWGWVEILSLGFVSFGACLLGGTSLLRAVKVASDGPIYHLYFAARWWKSGNLDLVAAPFGENAAPYFPAIGDLWFTWLMVGWGGDRLAKVGQAPFFVVCGWAAYALARRLGADRPGAFLATSWFLSSTPFLLFTFEPNVDTVFIAGYLLATFFLVRFSLRDGGLEELSLASLAAGCALGSKAIGVVFLPPLIIWGTFAAWRRGTTARARAAGVALAFLLPLVPSVYFFARNAWLTGNFLYPLHVQYFGKVWLAGWYGPEVMKRSRWYLPVTEWRMFVDIMLGVLDPRLAPVWVAALAGGWAWGAHKEGREVRLVWLLAALAAGNVALYWLAVPYRTQQRFVLQALGLAVPVLALLFDRSRWLRVAGVALLVAHVLSRQNWPLPAEQVPWDLSPWIKNAVPPPVMVPEAPVLLLARLGVLALCLMAVWAWGRALVVGDGKSKGVAGAWTAALIAASMAVAYPWRVDERLHFYPIFPEYVRGWLETDLRAGPEGVRIAYAGNALPYYLLGVGLRNEVRYINVDAHRDWLLHDYHRAASVNGPATWDHPRPGWDRLHPNYPAWLDNLRAERVQMLVLFRVNPDEGPHLVGDREGFPIEKAWAEAHPEVFEPLYGVAERDPQFRLYRVRPPDG